MKRLNDYFVSMKQRINIPQQMSLCGKLEAIIGNYFLAGAGIPDKSVEILYYDSKVGFYDGVPLLKENIVAYIVADDFLNDEDIAFDFESFEIIDSGTEYVNPKHFSVSGLINVLNNEQE